MRKPRQKAADVGDTLQARVQGLWRELQDTRARHASGVVQADELTARLTAANQEIDRLRRQLDLVGDALCVLGRMAKP